MSQALSDYFVREAGEYLSELERLLQEPLPDVERIFRLARGVRGSAQVAKADGIAEVAARLEGAARFILEGRIPWSQEIRERAARTAADIKALLPAFGESWGAQEEARVQEAVARWGGFADIVRTPPAIPQGQPVFSYVRTELTAVLAALNRAIAEVSSDPRAQQTLLEVLNRIRTLRGAAGADPLAPVLEVLAGLDDLLRAMLADALPAQGDRLEMLRTGRDALRVSLSALERGEMPSNTEPTLHRFRELRDRIGAEGALDADGAPVPIHSLFYEAGPHIVSSPVAPVAPAGADTPTAQVLDFLRSEATGLLDRAEALLASAHSAAGFPAARPRLAELAAAVAGLAGAYAIAPLVRAAQHAAEQLRSAANPSAARDAISSLRSALREPAASRTDGALAETQGAAAAAAETDVGEAVPVESLLLRSDRALEAALALRPTIDRLLDSADQPGTELQEALQELWDLVELGRSAEN
jgi:chemotaxis protein histidine kinase CheA